MILIILAWINIKCKIKIELKLGVWENYKIKSNDIIKVENGNQKDNIVSKKHVKVI